MAYIFSDAIDELHKSLIIDSIRILEEINAPIAKDCYFDVTYGATKYGYCVKNELYKYKIFIHLGISNDYYINTCIHELLHTIDNNGYTSHKGNWKMWADIVSAKTKYKIKVTGKETIDPKYIKKRRSYFNIRIESTCPRCNKKMDVYYKYKPTNNFTGHFCKNCHKPFLINLPHNPIKDNNENAFLNQKISLNLLSCLLPYLSNESTKIIIVEFLKNNIFSIEIKNEIINYLNADLNLKSTISQKYCEGVFDNSFLDLKSVFEFEGMFALTKFWELNLKHSEELIERLNND